MPDHVDPASLAQEATGNAADGGNADNADNAVPLPTDNPFSSMEKAVTSQEVTAGARRSKRLPVIVLWLVAIIVIVVDQASKQWALSALSDGRHTELFGRALGLVLVRNPGAAFSFATGQTWIFALIASCVVAIIILSLGGWEIDGTRAGASDDPAAEGGGAPPSSTRRGVRARGKDRAEASSKPGEPLDASTQATPVEPQ